MSIDHNRSDLDPEEGKFLWDGEFQTNPKVVGALKTAGYIGTPGDFVPDNPRDANRAPLQSLHLNPDGSTDDPLRIWSGETLMDLRKNQALKMRVEVVNGFEFLFIEAGDFETQDGKTQDRETLPDNHKFAVSRI